MSVFGGNVFGLGLEVFQLGTCQRRREVFLSPRRSNAAVLSSLIHRAVPNENAYPLKLGGDIIHYKAPSDKHPFFIGEELILEWLDSFPCYILQMIPKVYIPVPPKYDLVHTSQPKSIIFPSLLSWINPHLPW